MPRIVINLSDDVWRMSCFLCHGFVKILILWTLMRLIFELDTPPTILKSRHSALHRSYHISCSTNKLRVWLSCLEKLRRDVRSITVRSSSVSLVCQISIICHELNGVSPSLFCWISWCSSQRSLVIIFILFQFWFQGFHEIFFLTARFLRYHG